MNKNIYKTIRMGAVAVASLLACYSCSDTWDDHYNAGTDALVVDATIYQQLQAEKAKVSDFLEIIDATGYKALLDETQIVTVFAPVNGSFNKDSLMAEINNGHKDLVITRFVKNHIARYNYSGNSEVQDVELLNKKFTTLSDGFVSEDSISATETICNNGVLHIMSSMLPFHTNIYELLETETGTDSIYTILNNYDEDSLDVNRSIYRGVDSDGNRIYVDSVIIHTNDLMSRLVGYVHREDSNYTFIAPTNEAFIERLNEARNYFVYNLHEDNRDSLQNFYSNYFTIKPLIFNNNVNLHQDDSLVTTTYSKGDPKYNVFYKPFERGGILAPGTYTEKVDCSNGVVYLTDTYPSSIYDSFFREIDVECENTGSVNRDEDDKGNALFTRQCNYSYVTINDDQVSHRAYLDVRPSNTSAQPYIAYNIPNTLAGEYDMYLVTVPLSMGVNIMPEDSLKPYQFRVNMFYRTNRPNDVTSNWPTNRSETLKNPKGGSNFVSDPTKVDTIYLGTTKFTECYYHSAWAGVMIQIQSYISSAQTKNYSRRMLLDRIILMPAGQSLTALRGKEAREAELAEEESGEVDVTIPETEEPTDE